MADCSTFVAGPYFRVKQRIVSFTYKSRVFTADSRRALLMKFARPIRVAGDVKIECYSGKGATKVGGVALAVHQKHTHTHTHIYIYTHAPIARPEPL